MRAKFLVIGSVLVTGSVCAFWAVGVLLAPALFGGLDQWFQAGGRLALPESHSFGWSVVNGLVAVVVLSSALASVLAVTKLVEVLGAFAIEWAAGGAQ